MAGAATIARGNVLNTIVLTVNLTPAGVAANVTAEQNFTVPGLVSSDQVSAFFFQSGPYTVNVDCVNFRVTAANQLTVAYQNPTAGTVTPPAGVYYLEINRLENPAFPLAAIT